MLLYSAPTDYLELSDVQVVIQPTEDQVVRQIAIIDDVFHENEEVFAVQLSVPSDEVDAVWLAADEANVTITDDDG